MPNPVPERDRTLADYEDNAAARCASYEATSPRPFVELIVGQLEKDSRILELAAGSGKVSAMLQQGGFCVTPTDASTAMLEQAGRYHPELSTNLKTLDLLDPFPFEAESFHACVANRILMHLKESDLKKVISEIARILSRDGKLIMTFPLPDESRAGSYVESRGRYFNNFSEQTWLQLLEAAGFTLQERRDLEIGVVDKSSAWVVLVLAKGAGLDSGRKRDRLVAPYLGTPI